MRPNMVVALSFSVLALGASLRAAGEPLIQLSPDQQSRFAAEIKASLAELASRDSIDNEAGIIGLSALGPKALPMIEDAAAKSADPRVSKDLHDFIDREKPLLARRLKVLAKNEAERAWARADALATYDRGGFTNPKWDAAAHQAILTFVAGKPNRAVAVELKPVIDGGCQDPFIAFILARSLETTGLAGVKTVQHFYGAAANGMAHGRYTGYRRAACYVYDYLHLHAFWGDEFRKNNQPDPAMEKELSNLGTAMKAAFNDACQERVPPQDLYRLAADFTTEDQLVDRERQEAFDAFYPPLDRMDPGNTYALTLKGAFYTAYAWDARGDGYANTVTPEGAKTMQDRLKVAEEALTAAWDKDPANAEAATKMINVELGQGQGRDRMELWYGRAMQADPDFRDACRKKLYYLEPKWYGSPKDMLEFGNDCLQQQNWYGDTSFTIISAIYHLADYSNDPQPFLIQPGVWRTISGVYESYLRHFPDNTTVRCQYIEHACRAGKWDVALKQFRLLGDNAEPAIFGGVEKLDELRATAVRQGGGGL